MRKRTAKIAVLALVAAGTFGWAWAQVKEEAPDRAVVPLSNPAKPAKVEVSVIRGSVNIKAYEGREIVVEARTREKALMAFPGTAVVPVPPRTPEEAAVAYAAGQAVASAATVREAERSREEMEKLLEKQQALAKKLSSEYRAQEYALGQYLDITSKTREATEKKTAGLKQLSGSSSGLEIEEEANVVRIRAQSWKAATDLVIQVPVSASLEVRSSMDGAVLIEGVSGEIDVNNINGPVTLKNVSGTALVHTVSGDIEASLTRIAADKPLSFSSMNGDIDITLPADVKASLKMKTDGGEIYTDFDVNLTRRPSRAEATERTETGKYRITFDKSLLGTINGGGQEISLNTFSGDIFIRKRK